MESLLVELHQGINVSYKTPVLKEEDFTPTFYESRIRHAPRTN